MEDITTHKEIPASPTTQTFVPPLSFILSFISLSLGYDHDVTTLRP